MGISSTPAPDDKFDFNGLHFKMSGEESRSWRDAAAHSTDFQIAGENMKTLESWAASVLPDISASEVEMKLAQENMKTIETFMTKARPDLAGWTSYKVPDALINHDFLKLQYDLVVPPALTAYMQHENALMKQIKAMSKNYPKPNEALVEAMQKSAKFYEAVAKANKMWLDIQRPTVIDGLFTVPNIWVAHLNIRSEFAEQSKQYTSMYLRIAEELRREREELNAMFDAVKSTPAGIELERLMSEFSAVCKLSDGVHKRLCDIEIFTSSRDLFSVGFVDEFVADLRLDHGRMDDALKMIGEIPASMIFEETPFVARTWFRLRGITKRLRSIDRKIEWLFRKILD